MNKIYKTVWSKVKNTYVVVSEIAKSHSKAVSSRQRKSIAAVMTVLALGFAPGGVYAAIDGVTTFVEPGNQNVKIGNGISLRNNVPENGAVAIGDHAEIDDYVMQEGSIAIGKNAFVENMWGFQDKTFRFGMVTPAGDKRTDPYLPAGIAIGQNTYARSGGIMLGDHKYIGKLGDTTVDSTTDQKKRRLAVLVGATTLGLNSYSAGAFATTTGAYSIMSNAYDGNTNQGSGAQNFGAVINGSFNSIESKTSGNSSSGIANAVVGTANRTFNANGALVFGAGNEITNSVEDISLPTFFPNDAKELADGIRSTVRGKNGDGTSGGAVLAIGGGNLADYSSRSQLSGVGNTLKGSAAKIASYNFLNGYRNTGINISYSTLIGTKNTVSEGTHNIIVGDNHKLSDASHNVVLGSADTELETKVSDTVILGHNANSTVAGGVALGSRSVADRGKADREQVYLHENDDVKATVKGDLAAISVGNADETRQITGVAAGTKDTDAVNVAQLKAMTGGGSATSVHFFSVKGSESSKNYKNDGAKENGAIAIGANAAAEKSGSVAMGFNTTAGGSGSIVIGESTHLLANEENRGDNKGTGSIIIGNESSDAGGTKDHAASDDTLIGSLNSVGESNGVFVRGTGNIVTNAYHYEDLTEEDMQKFMDFFMQGKPAGEYFEKTGSHISVNGDGNYVDNALYSQISGVNNKLTGTDTLPAEYNIITGNRNTLENASNNIVTGDKYKLAGVKHAVIIGSSDEEKEVKVSDIVMVGHNANATVASGVALGSGSVADRAGFTEEKKGVFSEFDLNGKTAAAVSVGTKDKLRQIINVGDATEDTDAVNLRQLKAVESKITQAGAETQKHTSVTAGKNISVSQNSTNAEGGKNYEVSLAKDIDLGQDGSIKAGDTIINKDGVTTNTVKAGDTTINNDGVTIKDGPVITKTNVDVNNQQIHHVKDGTADDDAATVGQVNKKIDEITKTVAGSSVTGGTIGEDGKISLTKADKTTVELQGQLKDISARAGDYEIKDNKVTIGLEDNYSKKAAGNIVIKDVAKASDLEQETKERKDADKVITETIGAANKDELKTSYQDTTYIKNSTTLIEADKALDKAIGKNAGDIKKNTETINILGKQVGNLDTRVNRVGAGAAALAALHPLDFDPDDKWDFAAGYGNYKGANAAAIGAYYRPNEDTMFSVGGSFGGGENMVNAGVSVKLGQGNHVSTSKVAMAKDMLAMQKRMAEMEAQMAKMQGFIGALTGMDTQTAMFPDVPENHWAYEYVKGLCEQGIIEGYPDGNFNGNRSMTRYEFAAMLYRALGKGVNLDARAVKEFAPELGRIRVDVISQNKEGQPVIERVRVNEEKKEK